MIELDCWRLPSCVVLSVHTYYKQICSTERINREQKIILNGQEGKGLHRRIFADDIVNIFPH